MSSTPGRRLSLRYEVAPSDDWTLPVEPVPESQPHDLVLDLLKALLVHWIARTSMDAQVARNLAVRWDGNNPKVGVDPDLCLISPRTPEGDQLSSLCLWKPGHTAPLVSIEVVSENRPHKDYVSAPERHAASGARELWVFDPKLAGPAMHGGRSRLQLWVRGADEFTRVYAGDGPVRSPAIGGWLFAVDEGQRLRIAEDEAGTRWWMTGEEAERAAKEAALARVKELEAELARLRS